MRHKLVCDVCKKVIWINGSLDTTTIPHKFTFDTYDPMWRELCEHMHDGKFDVVDVTVQKEVIQ